MQLAALEILLITGGWKQEKVEEQLVRLYKQGQVDLNQICSVFTRSQSAGFQKALLRCILRNKLYNKREIALLKELFPSCASPDIREYLLSITLGGKGRSLSTEDLLEAFSELPTEFLRAYILELLSDRMEEVESLV